MNDNSVYYEKVDFEGIIQNSLLVEENIDDLISAFDSFIQNLDSRIKKYYIEKDMLGGLEHIVNDLNDDITNVNNFHNWITEGYQDLQNTILQTENIASDVGNSDLSNTMIDETSSTIVVKNNNSKSLLNTNISISPNAVLSAGLGVAVIGKGAVSLLNLKKNNDKKENSNHD